MARPKKEETDNENSIDSKDILSSILTESKGDHFNDTESKSVPISSGSLLLDKEIKIRSGQVIRLAASGAELGKTSEAFVLSANYMKVMPKSKTLYIKAEARLSPELKARSGHKFVTDPAKWEYGTIFIWAVNYFETIASALERLLKEMHDKEEHLCIILDSLDGCILKSDAKKDVWGNDSVKVAGVPLLMKLLFRRLALPISHYDALFIITTQYSAAIKLDPYAKNEPRQVEGSGGSSIGHQSDYVLYYCPRYNGDYILENPDEKPDPVKNRIVGNYAVIEIRKSGSDVTGTKIKVPIAKNRIGSAIWVEKEVIDLLFMFELVRRKGAWCSFDKLIIDKAKESGVEIKEQHQGINGLFEYVQSNEGVYNFLLEEVKKVL